MRNDITKKITNVLVTGRDILECYKDHGCPTSGIEYKRFVFDSIKILLKAEDHNFEGYVQWLVENEGNPLGKESSGSLYTALGDPDNLLAGCGGDGELEEDEYEFFETLFKALFN